MSRRLFLQILALIVVACAVIGGTLIVVHQQTATHRHCTVFEKC